MKRNKPLLSIGIIFKNNIRSLERCLTALEPLRKAIPCQLVMADTGSSDGSRKIAENYADLVFDFPWINDFAAARNAVMDRCTGVWYLTVDSDEYLDPDITELKQYLKAPKGTYPVYGNIVVRNYRTRDLNSKEYTDFYALRLVRMDTGSRYVGTIHECLSKRSGTTGAALEHTILHHDGYVQDDQSDHQEKMERNMVLLRQELKEHPNDLRRLLQCIESCCYHEEERKAYIFQAVELLQSEDYQEDGAELYVPHLFRHVISNAVLWDLSEMESWLEWGEQTPMIAKSISFRVDVCASAALYYFRKQNDPAALKWAERYETGCTDYDAKRYNVAELCTSVLVYIASFNRSTIRMIRCECLRRLQRQTELLEQIESLDVDSVSQDMSLLSQFLYIMVQITEEPLRVQAVCAKLLEPHWAPISADAAEKEREERKQKRRNCVSFAEQAFCKCQWSIFLQAPESLGVAARSMEAQNPEEITAILQEVTEWEDVPMETLAHAVKRGAVLPASFYRTGEENLRTVAAAIGSLKDIIPMLPQWSTCDHFSASMPRFQFLFQLITAALRGADWEAAENLSDLCELFVELSAAYIPALYNPKLLEEEENWMALPGVHRFALYLTKANTALEQGDELGYVRNLRLGLETAPAMKHMVDFLLEQLEEKKRQTISPELLELAEKVRAILAQYAPDDPAIQVLKQSEAYQRVAYLVEGVEAPAFGGLYS